MELSVNFLVMLILSIVVFAVGITVIYKIINSSTKLAEEIDNDTRVKIEQVLTRSGSSVEMPFNKKDIKRNDYDVFAIGIQNNDPNPAANYFTIDVFCTKGYAPDNSEICVEQTCICDDGTCCANWLRPTYKCHQLDKGQLRIFTIPVLVSKEAQNGQYIFRAEVKSYIDSACSQGRSDYGSPKKFYVTVKG